MKPTPDQLAFMREYYNEPDAPAWRKPDLKRKMKNATREQVAEWINDIKENRKYRRGVFSEK